MKHFLIAILALATIAGCGEPEATATTNESAEAENSADDSFKHSSDISDEIAALETSEIPEDSGTISNSVDGLAVADLVGEWIGKTEFVESDREVYKSMGFSDEELDSRIAWIKSAQSTLRLNGDMTFGLSTPLLNEQAELMESSWFLIDANTITLIMKYPGNQSGMPIEWKVSDDKKTLEFGDNSGVTKSKTIYSRK